MSEPTPDWRQHGVRVVPGDRLDANTAQTPGMHREAAISRAMVGAERIWAGTVAIEPNARTGPHHHGPLESVIFVVEGRARMRWGERLEYLAEAGPGDFIYVPPFVPHQEINALPNETLRCAPPTGVRPARTCRPSSCRSSSTPPCTAGTGRTPRR